MSQVTDMLIASQNVLAIKQVALLARDLTLSKSKGELTDKDYDNNEKEADKVYMAIEDEVKKGNPTYAQLYTAFLKQVKTDIETLLKD